METWFVMWVLTMSYCQSPEGKTACEPVEDTYRFTDFVNCEVIHHEMVKLYDKYTNIILYKDKTKCEPLVLPLTRLQHFDSTEEADEFVLKQLSYYGYIGTTTDE